MPSDLTLYTNPMSRGRIARWMLEETGAPYGVEVLSFDDSIRSATYREINPMAKVPSIRHGDVVVTETPAICAYLADAFPMPAWHSRRQQRRLLPLAVLRCRPVQAATYNTMLASRCPTAGDGRLRSFERVSIRSKARSRHTHIAGEAFSAAESTSAPTQLGVKMMQTIEARRPSRDTSTCSLNAPPSLGRVAWTTR